MYKNKAKCLNEQLYFLLIVSLFIFSQELRSIIGQRFYELNILGILVTLAILLNNITKKNINKLILLYFSIWLYIITATLYEPKLTTLVYAVAVVFFPLILVIIQVKDYEYKYILEITLKILNSIIILITFIGILELVFGIKINLFIGKFMSERTYDQILINYRQTNEKRLYSFMGHPLYNTELYLIYITLNLIYSKYISKKEISIIKVIIATIGICLTGSKTGTILLALVILFLYKNNNKIKKIILISLGFLLLIQLGLLDTVIYRFTSVDLTTGRSEKWKEIESTNLYHARYFIGYGRKWATLLNNTIQSATSAFEYPIRMFSFEIGIVNTAMIYMFIMIIPISKLIKRRQFYLLFCFIIVLLDVNTFNGIAISGDKMLIFCFFTFLILNLSDYLKSIGI